MTHPPIEKQPATKGDIADVKTELVQRISNVDQRISHLDQRLTSVEDKVDAMDHKLTHVSEFQETMYRSLQHIEALLSYSPQGLVSRVERVEKAVGLDRET